MSAKSIVIQSVRQQGAALIVVLSLLTISLMVGLSSMHSSQIDERLAGNYRSQSEAQMNAESLASLVFNDIYGSSPDFNHVDKYMVKAAAEVDDAASSWAKFEAFVDSNSSSCMKSNGGGACWVKVSDDASNYFFYEDHNVVSFGLAGDEAAYGLPVAVDLKYKKESNESIVTKFIGAIDKNLINTVVDPDFSSSSNQKAKDWVNKIEKDEDLFPSVEAVVDFRTELYRLSQSGEGYPVEFFNADEVKKGDISGASGGIVVIEGDGFKVPNNFVFEGLMVVFGNQFRITGGGTTVFDGAILHVPYTCGENGCEYEAPSIEVSGGNGEYNAEKLQEVSESITSGKDVDAEIIGIDAWWQ